MYTGAILSIQQTPILYHKINHLAPLDKYYFIRARQVKFLVQFRALSSPRNLLNDPLLKFLTHKVVRRDTNLHKRFHFPIYLHDAFDTLRW